MLLDLVRESGLEQESNLTRKKAIWVTITERYNDAKSDSMSDAFLSKSWSNLKYRAKAKKSAFVKARKGTGGGRAPKPLDTFIERVLEVACENTDVPSKYDSEAVARQQHQEQQQQEQQQEPQASTSQETSNSQQSSQSSVQFTLTPEQVAAINALNTEEQEPPLNAG